MTVEKPLSLLEGLAPIVGLRIRESRTEKGMSQKDLVGERFSKSYISSIERGKITPSLKALEYIAKRLSVSVSYLLTGLHPSQQNSHQTMITVLDEEESPARWDLLITEARVLREQHRFEQARSLLITKVRVRQLSVEQLKQLHFTLAQLYIDLGNTTDALPELETARDLADKTSDFEMLARVRQLTGSTYILQGKSVLAIEQLRGALQAIETGLIKEFHFKLAVYSNLGILHHQLGDEREAIAMYREALRVAEDSSSPDKLASLYWNLSATYRESGNLAQARLYATKSLALYESFSDLRMLTQLRSGFGVIMMEAKQFEEAEQQFDLALKLANEQNNPEALVAANMNLADLYLEQGDTRKARHYSDAMQCHLDAADPMTRGQAYSSRGSFLAAMGDNDNAVYNFEQAVQLIEKTPAKELLSKIYFRYARTLSAKGEPVRAAELFERAYRQLGRPGLVAER
ncbi:MAG: tetratricopeptide repeat protein [Chloroflexota bacterium]|nr:tetratricopeptide repeat protein [Chloroflexota bacterium]